MRKLLLVVLFASIIGCTVNTRTQPTKKPGTFNGFQGQPPRTTVLYFNPVIKERKPAELPPPNHFPTKQVRPKKFNK